MTAVHNLASGATIHNLASGATAGRVGTASVRPRVCTSCFAVHNLQEVCVPYAFAVEDLQPSDRSVRCPEADVIPRKNLCWNDGFKANKPESRYFAPKGYLPRLTCSECEGNAFEVLETGQYETSARCIHCGAWCTVHSG